MALEGTLRDFSLADIFQLIGIQKKTGVLTLRQAGEVVTVSFLNGSVVSADSANKRLEDRLGNVLVKSGRLSQVRLQDALKVQRATLQRLGHILVRGRYIEENDLREALRLQVSQIVYRLFRWKDGDYQFSQEDTVDYDREHFTPLNSETILMEGIRMIDEWPIIERKIRSFDMVFRKTRPDLQPVITDTDDGDPADLDSALSPGRREAAAADDPVRLRRDEARLYELLDGHRSVQEVIDRGRMGDFDSCRILYDLLSRNLIAAVDATPAAPSEVRVRVRVPVRVGPAIERMAYLALAAAVAVSIATIDRSPLSGGPLRLVPPVAVDRIGDLIARSRLERLDEAVRVYFLQKGFYPDDLADLVKGGLVGPTAVSDPWGRRFGFLSTAKGYRIIAYDGAGHEDPARSLSGGRLESSAASAPAGEAAARWLPGPKTPSR